MQRYDQCEPAAMSRHMWRGLLAAALCMPLWAHAQTTDPVSPTTNLVAVTGAPAPTQESFTIATAQDLTVTLKDFQVPAPLATATVVVTQGSALVGTATMSAPASTATLALPGAVGAYTLRVIGTPNSASGVGTFNVCVAPTASPSACLQSASIAGNITEQSTSANPTTVSTSAATLTVTTTGSYTFTYGDDQFPVPLAAGTFSLALFQGSQPVTNAVPLPASPATLPNLPAGVYTLLAVAQADPTAKAGLYGITVTGPAGVAPLLSASYPVGLLQPAATVKNPSAQSLTLTVTDFAFPAALTSASALVTAGGTVLGTASAGAGASTLANVPAEALQVWSYGAAGTSAGTYEVDLGSTAGSLLQTAAGVNTTGSYAYAYVPPKPLAAGSYTATASDFQFPAALSSLAFAIVQNHAILKQSAAAGSVSFTAAAGPVVLLAAAAPASGTNGLFDINVQTSASSVVFDQVQTVSPAGGFVSQPITLGTSGNFNVTLTDLKFPAAFSTLALVGSSAGTVLGKIFGGGTFPITASSGNYQFTVVAIPASQQQYGLYGIGVVDAPPTVTLSASPASVTAGGTATLTWTTTSATACSGSGGTFTGSQATGSGSLAVSVAATTTYTLTCTGPGGSASQSATVTATAAVTSSGGGGGAMDSGAIAALALLVLARAARSRLSPSAANRR